MNEAHVYWVEVKSGRVRSTWKHGLGSSIRVVTHPLSFKARQPATGRPSRTGRRSDGHGFLVFFFKRLLTWTIFKVFIEFVTTLFLLF